MRPKPASSWMFAVALAVSGLADILAGSPQPVTQTISLAQWGAIFLHFWLWISGLQGWGCFLERKILGENRNAGIALALGSLACAMGMFLLGAAGLLLPALRWPLLIINALGCALNPPLRLNVPRPFLNVAVFLPLTLLVLLAWTDALVIHPYWDSLHHHLLGPRLWWEASRMYFPAEAISAYQEGGFEQLFLWPHFLFAKAGGFGLLPVQIFAQLTHAVVGFGGSLLLVWPLLKREIEQFPSRVVALTLFAIPASLQFGIPMAKNDWGIVLWTMAGITLFLEERVGARLVAGLLLGFTLMAKFSAAYMILPALFLETALIRGFRDPRQLVPSATGFLAGMLPLAFRNMLGAGDPFFPLLAKLYPLAAIGPTWREALAAYQQGFASPLARVFEWFHEFLYAPLLLGLPWIWARKESPALRLFTLLPPMAFLLFLATAGAPVELRLLGPVLPLSGLLAGILLDRMAMRSSFPAIFSLLCLGLLLPFVPFRWDTLRRLPAIAHPEAQARAYVGAEAQAWFREHYWPGMKAAFLVDTRLYHSVPYPMVRIWDAPALDEKLRASTSPEDFLHRLKTSGFSHLILTQEKLDLFYPARLVAGVEGWALAHPAAVVFRTPYSMVVDLSRAERENTLLPEPAPEKRLER